jgi:hypothetical protein
MRSLAAHGAIVRQSCLMRWKLYPSLATATFTIRLIISSYQSNVIAHQAVKCHQPMNTRADLHRAPYQDLRLVEGPEGNPRRALETFLPNGTTYSQARRQGWPIAG